MSTDGTQQQDRWAVEISLLAMRVVVGAIFAAHGRRNCSEPSAGRAWKRS